MKKLFVLTSIVLALSGSYAGADTFIRIVQPYENASIPPVKSSFVFGAVSPATASVIINGVAVKPYTNGGFLTMIPFEEGRFKIEAIASDGVSVSSAVRYVNVQESMGTYPITYKHLDPLSPRTRVVLRTGDLLTLTFQAAPSGTAFFRLAGGENIPMQEQPGEIGGIYKGVYRIQPADQFEGDDVTFSLKRKDGRKITAKAGAEVTVQRRRTPRMVELREDAILLTGPEADLGYYLFLLKGTRMEVTGEWGDYLRVRLTESNEGWIRAGTANELPVGTPPAKSVAGSIRVDSTGTSTLIELPLQHRHAFRVDQITEDHRLLITLYGVMADTDRIRYKTNGSVVKELSWRQYESGTTTLDIETTQKFGWGYDVRYEGNKLIVEIRHRPPWAPAHQLPLKGLKIAIDAGHSHQSFGTIGPWGNTEASVNLGVANEVKKELERRGAQVVMTQDGTKEISLQDRVNLAWAERAHMFISIHADACPEGQNPRDVDGYSVHYYHPQSHPLARALFNVYGEKSKIREQGLWRSNLAVCRATQMPSVLFEQGFLVVPEMEELFITPAHQALVAQSIATAIYQFMNETKP